MNLNEELRQAITALFLSGADEEHDGDEMLELLEDVDFDAVRQALLCEGRHIYEFEVSSEADESMNYRSYDLFGMQALCLQRDFTHRKPNVFSYSYELLLLEDCTFAVTSCYRLNIGCGVYISEYRTIKAYDWRDSPMEVDFVGISDYLTAISASIAAHGYPIIED